MNRILLALCILVYVVALCVFAWRTAYEWTRRPSGACPLFDWPMALAGAVLVLLPPAVWAGGLVTGATHHGAAPATVLSIGAVLAVLAWHLRTALRRGETETPAHESEHPPQ